MTRAIKSEFASDWRVLLGAVAGIATGLSSLYFYAFGIFIKPLTAEFGWSRGQVSLGVLLGTLAAAVMSPAAGRLADRFGSRNVAVCSLLLLAAGIAAHNVFVTGLTSFLAVTILTNAIGAGSSPLPYTRLVASRFVRHRGLALGLALGGTGIGAMLVPALLTPLVGAHGWRAGYLSLSLTILCVTPVIGLLLPGERLAGARSHQRLPFGQLLAAPGFLPLAAIFFFAAVAVLGAVVQFVPMLTDAGLSAGQAGRIAGLIGVAAIVGRLLIGALLDRLPPPRVTAGVFLAAALGMTMLALGGSALAVPGALVLGLAIGAEVDLLAFHTARYFPLSCFGQANGTLYALFLVGGGLGPALWGLIYDYSRTYTHAFFLAALLLMLSATISLRLPKAQAI